MTRAEPSAASASSHVAPVAQASHGRTVDLAANERIPILMEMVAGISRARTPGEVLQRFAEGYRRLEGPRAYVSLSTRSLAPGEYRITRLLQDHEIESIDQGDPWRDRERLPIHRGGFLGPIIESGEPVLMHDLHVTGDAVVGDALAPYGSLMAVPLLDDGRALNWAIFLRREPAGYTVEDLEEAIMRSNLVGTSVRNVLAAREVSDAHERIRREVDQIARIQRALLPQQLPEITGVQIGASFRTFDTAGGDMYDFAPLRFLDAHQREPDASGPWFFGIADASGHGPAAATVIAMLNAVLYAAPGGLDRPAEVMTSANRHMCAKRLPGTFVTAVLGRYDPRSQWLTFARAGHDPPILMSAGDGTDRLRRLDGVGGLPLGIDPEAEYEEMTVQLRRADTVVLYTDGITESKSPAGTMFGVSGIEHSLAHCSGEPDCVIDHVTSAVAEHEAGRRPADDQTIVVLRIGEQGRD